MKQVRVRLLAGATMPARRTGDAAGFDLAANESCVIPARGFTLVGTGVVLELPRGMEAQVRPRSGLAANHGIGILNSPGTIDSDYRGEVKVVLFNCSGRPFRVHRGDRIAQLVFASTPAVALRRACRLSRTRRGAGGFGHTG